MANQTESAIVDTSGFYTLASTADGFHSDAERALTDVIDGGRLLWTTSYVVVETQALLNRRLGFSAVVLFGELVESAVHLLWIGATQHRAAWSEFMDHNGRGLSLVDWTVAIAARRMDAPVFSFDGGFTRAGLQVIPS